MYKERNPKYQISRGMSGKLNYQTSLGEHWRHVRDRSEHRLLFDMEEKYINEVVIPKVEKMDSDEIKNTLIKQFKNKRGDWEIIGFLDNDLERTRTFTFNMYNKNLNDYQYDQERNMSDDVNPRFQKTDEELRLMEILYEMTQKEYNVYIKRFKNNLTNQNGGGYDIVDTRGIEESLLKEWCDEEKR